jgi:hypothetical protein
MESIAFVEKMNTRRSTVIQLLTNEEILMRTKFYRTYERLKDMLTMLESFVSNSLISHVATNLDFGTISVAR